jgi:hypothetical protein
MITKRTARIRAVNRKPLQEHTVRERRGEITKKYRPANSERWGTMRRYVNTETGKIPGNRK